MATIYERANMLSRVLRADDQEVILYLYEGALDFLDRAEEARRAGDTEAGRDCVERAVSILIELSACLDYDRHGALALKLDQIYRYMIGALSGSPSGPDAQSIETSRGLLTILAEAWRQAVQRARESRWGGRTPGLRVSA